MGIIVAYFLSASDEHKWLGQEIRLFLSLFGLAGLVHWAAAYKITYLICIFWNKNFLFNSGFPGAKGQIL